MPNQFLAEIHEYITEAISAATKRQHSAECMKDRVEESFYAGQIAELQALRRYLSERFDLNTQRYY